MSLWQQQLDDDTDGLWRFRDTVSHHIHLPAAATLLECRLISGNPNLRKPLIKSQRRLHVEIQPHLHHQKGKSLNKYQAGAAVGHR